MADEGVDTGVFERALAERAPAVREWPGWFRRNFTPASLYTIGGVLATALIAITTVVVTARNQSTSNESIAAELRRLDATLTRVDTTVTDIKSWKDRVEDDWRKGEAVRNPYIGGGAELRRDLEKLRRADARRRAPPQVKPKE